MIKITTECFDTPLGVLEAYTLTNESGASVQLSPIGAGVTRVTVPDRDGRLADVALGYEDLADYFYDGPCAGKTPGRYANRIAEGHLVVDGTLHQLAINNGPNALHGGPEGFSHKVWDAEVVGETVVFSLVSPDGDENYPGTLTARVAYTWSEDNVLRIEYSAITDAPTVVNLTNHSYWNLAGHDAGTALNHVLQLNASRWLPTSDSLIPTGELAPVAGTPMDFTAPKAIGRDIKADFDALRYGKGYDNCWVIDGHEDGGLHSAALLSDPASGRTLEVLTDQPGVQVYTGNWLEGCPAGKGGHVYHDYDAVAIECQGFPDAPNKPQFPSQELRPDEEYRRLILFRFATI